MSGAVRAKNAPFSPPLTTAAPPTTRVKDDPHNNMREFLNILIVKYSTITPQNREQTKTLFQLRSIQFQLKPHPSARVSCPHKQIREDFKWFMISGRATASRKLQSGFGLELVIDGMQQIKREEESRNNL